MEKWDVKSPEIDYPSDPELKAYLYNGEIAELFPAEQELVNVKTGASVDLTLSQSRALVYFFKKPGKLVSNTDLDEALADYTGNDNRRDKLIADIRLKFRDIGIKHGQIIKTVRGSGRIFNADITPCNQNLAAKEATSSEPYSSKGQPNIRRPRLENTAESFLLSNGTNFIGREVRKCNITLRDLKVSRIHVCIICDTEYTIQDMGSINGTRVNGISLPPMKSLPLCDGDRIEIADTTFIFHL